MRYGFWDCAEVGALAGAFEDGAGAGKRRFVEA